MRRFRARTSLLVAVIAESASDGGRYIVASAAQAAPTPQVSSGARPSQDPKARLSDEIRVVEELLANARTSPGVDRGAALYLLAHHYARLGDSAKALKLLEECVALDEGFDPSDAPAFASLKQDAKFRELVAEVRRRYPAVHHARVAFTVQQNDLMPEGLVVDPAKRLFYMSSMHRKKIVKITLAGEVSDFVADGVYDLMPVGGVHVDADHGIWCATDPGEKNRSEIVHFDAQGKLLERYAAPGAGPHDLNDLVLRGTREIFVTDTEGNRVYHFDRHERRFAGLILSRPVFYPNGITLSEDGNVLYIADVLGVIWLNLTAAKAGESRDVTPTEHDTLAGVDGLYWHRGSLIGVQYGTGASRVMRWTLSADGRSIVRSEVLERGTELVKDPTTGAILGDQFYFMANTGIDNLDDNGNIVDKAKLEPLRMAVVSLNQ